MATAQRLPAWRKYLRGVDPQAVTDRAALAKLPVLRKSDLPATQRGKPPFGGLLPGRPSDYRRLMISPGPIFEPESHDDDPWRVARALAATGAGWRDIVLNTFSYHLTPGAWCFDAGARVLGCAVIPAGPGNSDAQLDLIEAYRPTLYAGVPDFLKILLDLGAAPIIDWHAPPQASGLGSASPTTTFLMPAARTASVQGGVLPSWQQGSSVTTRVHSAGFIPRAAASLMQSTSAWSCPAA